MIASLSDGEFYTTIIVKESKEKYLILFMNLKTLKIL